MVCNTACLHTLLVLLVLLSADWSIEALLHRWKLNCVDVPLEAFDADEAELAGSTLPGNHSVIMMIITMETEDAVP